MAAQTPVHVGDITADVPTLADANQRYTIYLPSSYTTTTKWPVILAFDPGGVGRRPVEEFRAAAEKYGYIVVGSNNSRNGPLDVSVKALKALWQEVQTRFAVDIHRMYTSGFSGGARIAALSAILCRDCIAGVVACGAGFPTGYRPDAKIHFAYFVTVGTEDFNYSEIAELQTELDRLGVANVRRVFDGPHQWASPEILTEAVEWMELQAMRRKLRPVDETFIADRFSATMQRARESEQQGDPYGALRQYKVIAASFEGLANTAAATAKVRELDSLPAVAAARKRESDQLKREQALKRQLGDLVNQAFNSDGSAEGNMEARTALRQFKDSLKGPRKPEESQTNARVLGNMFAIFVEQAQQFLRRKQFTSAAFCFEVAGDVRELNPAMRYNAARAYALGGDKRNALRSLREAVAGGFKDVARMESDEGLKSIRGTKEYRDLIAAIPPPASPPRE